MAEPANRWRRIGMRLLGLGLLTLVLALLVEGAASAILIVREMAGNRPLAERLHTEYDAQLGWINRPDVTIEDLYGPGLDLHTNGQRFRNERDFDATVPAGRIRAICSGDSFTLGYGVADDQTWCAQLTRIDPRFETVNMGQGGYGVDQAYLWYWRIKDDLQHQLHLFAFVTNDFVRMTEAEFMGYPKPLLDLRGGELVITNEPVPRGAYRYGWLVRNRETLRSLAAVRLTRSLLHGDEVEADAGGGRDRARLARTLAPAIFSRLQRYHRQAGSRLVLVHLPVWQDYRKRSQWRDWLSDQARRNGWLYLDLVEELSRLEPAEAEAMFLTPEELDFPGAAGHYTARGNRFIAEALYRRLSAEAGISSRNSSSPIP